MIRCLLVIIFHLFSFQINAQENFVIEFTEFIDYKNSPEFVFPIEYVESHDSLSSLFILKELNVHYFLSSEYWNEKSTFTNMKFEVYNDDDVAIFFDSDNDNNWDKKSIIGKINTAIKVDLSYKYKENKILKIPCDLVISKNTDGYNLSGFFNTKCIAEFNSANSSHVISFNKYLHGLSFISVDDKSNSYNNPILLGSDHYRFIKFDYINNRLTLEKVDNSKKLFGTNQGNYVRSEDLKNAFIFHHIEDQDKNKIFYFWGHWCEPCISSMKNTQNFLDDLPKEKFQIINVSLLRDISNKGIADKFIDKYNITNNAFEFPTVGQSTHENLPFINLFSNKSYPNFIILDNTNKILFSEFDSDETVEAFVKSLE